jgi:hypothetical protein
MRRAADFTDGENEADHPNDEHPRIAFHAHLKNPHPEDEGDDQPSERSEKKLHGRDANGFPVAIKRRVVGLL